MLTPMDLVASGHPFLGGASCDQQEQGADERDSELGTTDVSSSGEMAFGTRSLCRSPLWVGCGFAAAPRSAILAGELSGGSRGTATCAYLNGRPS